MRGDLTRGYYFEYFFLLPLFHERARITLLLLNRTRENFISYFARVTVAPASPTSYTFLTQFVATAELVFEFSYLSLSLSFSFYLLPLLTLTFHPGILLRVFPLSSVYPALTLLDQYAGFQLIHRGYPSTDG